MLLRARRGEDTHTVIHRVINRPPWGAWMAPPQAGRGSPAGIEHRRTTMLCQLVAANPPGPLYTRGRDSRDFRLGGRSTSD